MKIVCDACSAKYSIADDKVKGKVFKIRCKKCSNIIVVRGGAGEDPAQPQYDQKETKVFDYQGHDDGGGGDGEAVWHVVVDQEQVGPLTVAEVGQRFNSGQIDGETYIWREGFADWQPLSAVEDFADLVASGGGASGGAAGDFSGASEDATTRADAADLFSSSMGSGGGGSRNEDSSSDLFATGGGRQEARPAAAASGSRLRGERNENSVLFSLNNLAALASEPSSSSAASSSSSSSMSSAPRGPVPGAGLASGEGSGLIDIRSMASAYLSDKGAVKPASPGIGSMDDLPVFSSGAFAEPAVIIPSMSSRGSSSKVLYALIGVAGLLAVVAVIMAFVLLKGDDSKPAAVATAGVGAGSEPAAKPTTGGTDPVAEPGKEPAAVKPADSGEESRPVEPAKVEPKAAETRSDKPERPSTRPEPRDTRPAARPDPRPEPVEKPADSGGSCDDVSCLLNDYQGACCQKFRKKASGGGSSSSSDSVDSSLPKSLTAADVTLGTSKVKARIQACGDRSSAKGTVKVSVKVGPDGSVSSATATVSPDAALGSCVSSAMEKATFRKTQTGGKFSIPYKF
jgi:predicted Zn finger-like uncharacterized protein